MNFSNVRSATFEQNFVLNKPTKSRVKLAELKQKLVDTGYYHSKNGITTCFVCGFTTGPWDLNSNPLKFEHNNCYWYNMLKNAQNNYSSHENLALRLETFRNGWVGVGSISKENMANAGFHYDPCQDELDRVSCSVCSLVLEGWENEDDPFKEHENRRPTCPYIKLMHHHKPINSSQEIELAIYNLKDIILTPTPEERNMTVEEYIKYQQEKAKQEFLLESDRILSHMISQGESIF